MVAVQSEAALAGATEFGALGRATVALAQGRDLADRAGRLELALHDRAEAFTAPRAQRRGEDALGRREVRR
ncbi:MAG: hypothetical protein KC479_15445, partial [Dehalococcoidia bacterium]|nr:hypothetical protein [Dehalococcoidia bacterium]